MNLFEVMERFPTHQSCIEYLEGIRWENGVFCPHCASVNVYRKKDGERVGRWHCKDCHASFNVLAGTVMQGTKVPIQKWFVAISLMINAKKSLSSCQLARDLGINQKTAWYMEQRIRAQMTKDNNDVILQGIIEADETYIGGKPRPANKRDDDNDMGSTGPRTKKTPVIGAVERGGDVTAKAVDEVTGSQILSFILTKVDTTDSTLMTDENSVYKRLGRFIEHETVNHQEQYVDGDIHTNTLEGFWGLLKRAWYGQHHKYKVQFLPLYIAEAVWKYNHRKTENPFDEFVEGCFA